MTREVNIAQGISEEIEERKELHEQRARGLSGPVREYRMTPEELEAFRKKLERKPQLPPVSGTEGGTEGRTAAKKLYDGEVNPMETKAQKNEASLPEEKDEQTLAIERLIKEKGLKGKVSIDVVRRVPKELLEEMVEKKLVTYEISKALGISQSYVALLRRLYDMPGDKGLGQVKPTSPETPTPAFDPPAIIKSEDPALYTTEPIASTKKEGVPLPEINRFSLPEKLFEFDFIDTPAVMAEMMDGVARALMKMRDDEVQVSVTVRARRGDRG
jgi:hypothetical protein